MSKFDISYACGSSMGSWTFCWPALLRFFGQNMKGKFVDSKFRSNKEREFSALLKLCILPEGKANRTKHVFGSILISLGPKGQFY